jgi:hypothetical protein
MERNHITLPTPSQNSPHNFTVLGESLNDFPEGLFAVRHSCQGKKGGKGLVRKTGDGRPCSMSLGSLLLSF